MKAVDVIIRFSDGSKHEALLELEESTTEKYAYSIVDTLIDSAHLDRGLISSIDLITRSPKMYKSRFHTDTPKSSILSADNPTWNSLQYQEPIGPEPLYCLECGIVEVIGPKCSYCLNCADDLARELSAYCVELAQIEDMAELYQESDAAEKGLY